MRTPGFIFLFLPLIYSQFVAADDRKVLLTQCDKNSDCADLPGNCFSCTFNTSCVYGTTTNVSCRAVNSPNCKGPKEFVKSITCAYCYQLPASNYECSRNDSCKLGTKYRASCTVINNVLCMGHRSFPKKVDCNYSSGFSWTTTLVLSIALGGFGVDRFHLGNWQEGIGKLFSFGGLGVWTLIDAILIATGYLKPGDSRYS